MYFNAVNDPNEIEFKVLYNKNEVEDLAKSSKISMYEYETVEKLCIEYLKPIYNIEGLITPFRYKVKPNSTSYRTIKNIEKNFAVSRSRIL